MKLPLITENDVYSESLGGFHEGPFLPSSGKLVGTQWRAPATQRDTHAVPTCRVAAEVNPADPDL